MARLALLTAGVLLLAGGCPRRAPERESGAAAPAAPDRPRIALVRSDLGLADGEYVRELDAALDELAEEGRISYLPAGELPAPLMSEGGTGGVGLPTPAGGQPGQMTLVEAEEVVAQAADADWLMLSTPWLLDAALTRIAEGELAAQLVLVMDDEGWTPPAAAPVPVYVVSYDIRPVAFLAGVAAAESSNSGMFVVLANEGDPGARQFLDAVWAGAKYHTNAAVVAQMTLPLSAADGLVDPETFKGALERARARMGQYFAANHYIVALGRATPSILYALASERAYVVGAYADLRRVREARILGCVLKHPGAALRHIIDAGPAAAADERGVIAVGLAQEAVGFTSFELYARRNPDGDDLAEAVESTLAEIRAGELDVAQLIRRFSEEEQQAPPDA